MRADNSYDWLGVMVGLIVGVLLCAASESHADYQVRPCIKHIRYTAVRADCPPEQTSAVATGPLLLCLGDSISVEGSNNSAYCLRAALPEGWTVQSPGVPTASCIFVESLTGHLIGDLLPGDVLSLMCRHVNAADYQANVDAVLRMEARAYAAGAHVIFNQQPRWDAAGGNAFEMPFWQDVRSQLDPRTVYAAHWSYWTHFGWHRWESLYRSDQVHMADGGAYLLAWVLTRAMRDLCLWLPLYPYPHCEDA